MILALCLAREVVKPMRNIDRTGLFQVAVCCPIMRDLPEAIQRGQILENSLCGPLTHGKVERIKKVGLSDFFYSQNSGQNY
jgi:hypothetical protein